MKEYRNYNTGRVKELFYNVLRQATCEIQASENDLNKLFDEFDELPEKNLYDDGKSITVKCYNIVTGDVIAMCVVRERYLKLIHDGELTSREHEYNLFKKYATVISEQSPNENFKLSRIE